ncbi:hypothetical protein WR25_15473 [Diploscapter pachys]|uniref:Uncharacterized protein n=1 Tax=Diploscapter pachys TaxID=2018661 RepID=A0A2A2KFQ2_9BILA|nr:hypothetical protein WR25_15473 [Diploscapter pachys]
MLSSGASLFGASPQIGGESLLLREACEQAQLGAAPKNIFGVQRPFLLAKIIHFSAEQSAPDGLAQVLRSVHTVKDVPGSAAVAVLMSSPPGNGASAVQLPRIWVKNGLSSAMADSASLREVVSLPPNTDSSGACPSLADNASV